MVVVLLGDILKLPPDNVQLMASRGLMRLEKAQVNVDAFKDLQLPFTVTGGFMELVHIDLNLHSRKKTITQHTREAFGMDNAEDEGVIVIVKNVLLIVGPGH